MSETGRRPAAGWYDDPTMVNTRRYWDGEKWTSHRQEVVPPRAAAATSPFEDDGKPSGWITFGYLFAVFFPPVGLIIGISRLGVEPKWAWKTIGISLGVMLLGIVLYAYNNP